MIYDMSEPTFKNAAAVELGRLGGKRRSKKQNATAKLNFKNRWNGHVKPEKVAVNTSK